MIRIVSIILSVIIDIFICIASSVNSIKDIWIPIVSFVGVYFGLISLFFIFAFLYSLCINKNKVYTKQNKFNHFLTISTMKLLLDLGHAKVKVTGYDKVPKDQKYVLVYNHTSNFDPIIQSYVLRRDNVIHISKPSNFNKPIGGPVSYRDCYIPINRESSKEALKTIKFASNYLTNQEFSIGVSPEGTRNKGDVSKLLPFRDGCFKLALMGNAPIVIVEMNNVREIAKRFPFKRTNVEMNVLRVLSYDEIKDLKTKEISEIVRTEIQDKLDSRYAN